MKSIIIAIAQSRTKEAEATRGDAHFSRTQNDEELSRSAQHMQLIVSNNRYSMGSITIPLDSGYWFSVQR